MIRRSGRRLGSFQVHELLGSGAMGEVYRARDLKLGREVAIKLLPERLSGTRDLVARFEREARLLASLNHPHIATLHDLAEDNGTRFLVMELVSGETLAQHLERGPPSRARSFTCSSSWPTHSVTPTISASCIGI